jgi:thiosulfate/3-mercaptopyruvate sulfurtransferase
MPLLKPAGDIRARYEAAGLKPGRKVVVYCQTGMQASHAYFTLKLTGFKPVLYDASMIEWSNVPGTTVEH